MPQLWTPQSLAESHETRKVIVYCDESGNSGPNYLDAQQPFYVLAGWVIPEDKVVAVSVTIEEFRKKVSPQAPELKSSVFLRGERQKHDATRLLKRLGRLGCIPLYLVAEKRYCVAGKIVETFLDPAYNTALRDAFTGDIETKQEFANSFYDRLPSAVLKEFAGAYRNPSLTSMRDALTRVVDASREHLNPELAEAFEGCRPQLDAIAEAELQDSELGSVSTTLNMPCLISFLMMVENLGRLGLVEPLRVVHDRHHAYEEGYKKIFKLHQGLHDWFAPTSDDRLGYGGLKNIPHFEVGDSKTIYPIQAADALAGVLNHLFSLANRGDTPTSADRELANMLLGGMLVTKPRVTWMLLSDTCIRRLGATFIGQRGGMPLEAAAPYRTATVTKPALPPLDSTALDIEKPKVGVPLFAIIGKRGGGLMMINDVEYPPAPAELKIGDKGPVALVFNSRTDAEGALANFDSLTEPQEVVEFNVKDLNKLIEKLEAVSVHTRVVILDAWTDRGTIQYLPTFVDGMKKSLGRVIRLVRSGLADVVFKRHDFGKHTVYSMLTSDGKYGASLGLDGKFFDALTREAAIKAVLKAHGLPDPESQKDLNGQAS